MDTKEDDSGEDDESDSNNTLSSENELTFSDTPYELVLPSSAWVEHCSMQRYYQQSFPLTAQNGDKVSQLR